MAAPCAQDLLPPYRTILRAGTTALRNRFGRELLGLEFIVKDGEGGCHGLEGATQVYCFDNSFVM